jgi:exopolysaccharide biosynthesis polyprenyl glycosylphosphotransferase
VSARPASPEGPPRAKLPAPAVAAVGHGSAVDEPPGYHSAPGSRRRGLARGRSFSKLCIRLALLAADALLIHLGFLLAYSLRYDLRLGPDQGEFFDAPFSAYGLAEGVLLAVMLALLSRRGLYRLKRGMQWLDEVGIIATATTTGISVLVMVFYLFRPGVTSRAMLFYAWVCIIVLLSALRLGMHWAIAQGRRRGLGLSRVLVVGAGHLGKMIMQQLAARRRMGYEIVGYCDDLEWARGESFGRFACLGAIDDLEQVIESQRVNEVIIALPSAEHERILEIVSLCERNGVGFSLVPDTFDLTLGTLEVAHVAGIPLIELREPALQGFDRALKRVIDVVVSAIALIVLAPIMLLVAIAVKLDSPGPVLIGQERVGAGGRTFRCYKVRSMYVDAEQRLAELLERNEAGGPIFKLRDDPRRTRVGRIIRKLSLDEVPQLWNVLVGDISLVGPRAPFPHEVAKYNEWQRRRLEATPGLTGLWQVSGRSDLSFDEMVMLDLYYIENWSLGLDLKIILQTIPAVITGRGAY